MKALHEHWLQPIGHGQRESDCVQCNRRRGILLGWQRGGGRAGRLAGRSQLSIKAQRQPNRLADVGHRWRDLIQQPVWQRSTYAVDCQPMPQLGCTSSMMSGSATVTVNANPTAFNVTGRRGVLLAGGSGVTVGRFRWLAVRKSTTSCNSTTSTPVHAGRRARASAISFVNQTGVGTYTVVATDGMTSCTTAMNGSAGVTAD